MRTDSGIEHPSPLNASAAGISRQRHATWLELFFDLVFVLAVAQLAGFLYDDLTPAGFTGFAFVFLPIWWVWIAFTHYADLFELDLPIYRVTMLLAMLASLALAMSVRGALGEDRVAFTITYVLLRGILLGLYVWTWWRVPPSRPLCIWYIGGFILGILCWTSSILVAPPLAFVLWGLGLLTESTAPILALRAVLRGVPVAASHLPERLGLFTIIVLGESMLVTGTGVVDTDWAPRSVLIAVFGFSAIAALWWLYFDRVDDEAIEWAFTGGVGQLMLGIAWAYGHLPLYAGLTATAVGIELAIVHGEAGALNLGERVTFCGGIAIALGAMTAVQSIAPGGLSRSSLPSRYVMVVVALALIPVGAVLPPVVITGVIGVGLAGLIVRDALLAHTRGTSGESLTRQTVPGIRHKRAESR